MEISAAKWGIQLSKAWGYDRLPVDVKQMAFEFSLRTHPEEPIIKIEPFPCQGFEGGLFKQQAGWTILYNPSASAGRVNFTIAHELGHYLLHRGKSLSFDCSEKNVSVGYDAREDFKLIENEADTFASYLLMPIDDFKQQIENVDISAQLLSQCATRYGVSYTAAALRWIKFTNQPAILVISIDGFVLWASSSQPARKMGFFIKSGLELPTSSLASLKQEGKLGLNDSLAEEFNAGVWFKHAGVKELLVPADNYNLQISVLLLDKNARQYVFDDDEEPQDTYDKMVNLTPSGEDSKE